ncbi:MAG: helix-turn-helix domain-containing protein [Candidatus Solibacter sp.]
MQDARVAATFADALMTVAEAAAIAKISPRTIHRWIKCGLIPGYGVGRNPRVLLDDVLPARKAPQTRPNAQATHGRSL